ncbi:hypothetical protein ACLOJK_017210 [Asimina triloba]
MSLWGRMDDDDRTVIRCQTRPGPSDLVTRSNWDIDDRSSKNTAVGGVDHSVIRLVVLTLTDGPDNRVLHGIFRFSSGPVCPLHGDAFMDKHCRNDENICLPPFSKPLLTPRA